MNVTHTIPMTLQKYSEKTQEKLGNMKEELEDVMVIFQTKEDKRFIEFREHQDMVK
jgi:hypothetical protein